MVVERKGANEGACWWWKEDCSFIPRPVQKIGGKGLVSTVCTCAQLPDIPGIPDNTILPPCAVILAMCIFNSTLLATLIVCKTCFVRLPATLR